MTEALTGLPNFLVFFGIAIALTATYLLLYTLATAHNEFLLIRQNVISAAVALGFSLVGFALPLASAIVHAQNILDCLIWGLVALAVQIFAYWTVRLVMRDLSHGARRVDGGFEVLKKASWTTSAGFADFYVLQTTSPDYNGDYSNLSVFVVDKDEIEAKPQEWDAMGLRGNQSGTLLLDWKFVPEQQLVGEVGDGAFSNDESVDPNFLIGSSGTWNGISLGAIDIACRHTTRKTHKDVGLRVCDYPTIQDAVGEAIMDTNASRNLVFSVANALDRVTDGSQKKITNELARGNYLHWLWQIKFNAAKNVAHVVDKMLHCCGGTGVQEGAAAAGALPARRQGRLGDGPDQRGAPAVRRQDRPAGHRLARLLERVASTSGR